MSGSALITLLTDFGEQDWFVASMKGVILTVNPQATIIDLSHRVTSHGIEEAAFLLKSCYASFPDGTIHVVVVDPGVGSSRRVLLVRTARYIFVAPDNGILSHIFEEESDVEVRVIEDRKFRSKSAGVTFDGRDLFAPVAARLSMNQPASAFGPITRNFNTFSITKPRWESGTFLGEIVYIDRFGNLISNITSAQVKDFEAATKRQTPVIHIANHQIQGLVGSYSEGDLKPNALINSNGLLEVFLREGHAASRLKIVRKTLIRLS
jgi:S-adenosylmethionine hydrolase